jgi:hypothetical protein
MVLILIFAEVLGLYGSVCHALRGVSQTDIVRLIYRLIVALIMNTKALEAKC